jgi:formylglycine-generating enzyme required for sulfatase activity
MSSSARTTRLSVCLAALFATACEPPMAPPLGHVELLLDTNAPLPSSAPSAPVAVFDSVQFEVFGDEGVACASCTREFGLTQEFVNRGATFIVRAPRGAVVHARLFASMHGYAALDTPRVIEKWVKLPSAPEEGRLSLRMDLPLESVGMPIGSREAPVSSDPIGRSAPLERAPPPTTGPPTAMCVGESFFWMGSAALLPEGDLSANEPRLVRLTPYCLDAAEMTVAELRATSLDLSGLLRGSGSSDPTDVKAFCSFDDSAGPRDELPVNCVPWEVARAACKTRGGDLPTEAEFEFFSSGLGRARFVWGMDPPTCNEAIFGRTAGVLAGDRSCAQSNLPFLPQTATELLATRDALPLGQGRTVVGLASNVAEWTREAFSPTTAGCGRAGAGVLVNPECPVTADATRISVRGGGYTGTAGATAAATRSFVARDKFRTDVGFRCVYR